LKEQFPTVLTSSLRETFNSCHKKSHYETILGIAPAGQNVHLEFGGAYASALETFRVAYYGEEYAHLTQRERYEEAVADGLIALMVKWDDYTPEEGTTKNFDRLVGAYIEYLVSYPPETDHAKPSMFEGKPRVEFSFVFTIPDCYHPETGDPMLFAGRADMMVDFTGGLFIFDDKTCGQMGATWAKQWDLRSQFTAYVAGARMADYNVLGAIVRGMCILKTMFKTREALVYRPDWMVERWKKRLTWDTQRMIEMYNNDYWPNTGEESGACSNYGGCPFKLLCMSANEQQFLKTHYKEYRWDPMAREGGKIEEVIRNAKAQDHFFPEQPDTRN
jgi:hypothetical protein